MIDAITDLLVRRRVRKYKFNAVRDLNKEMLDELSSIFYEDTRQSLLLATTETIKEIS